MHRPFRGHPAREQERNQGKGWQRVMRQFCFDQTENDENDRHPRAEIIVDRIPASPQVLRQPGKFDRPREKTDKDRYEIKWQQEEIDPERIRAVTFHRGKGTANDMSTDSHNEELSMRSKQRWNSPKGNDGESKENATRKFELPGQLSITQKKFRRPHSRKRKPSNRPFGQKAECQ